MFSLQQYVGNSNTNLIEIYLTRTSNFTTVASDVIDLTLDEKLIKEVQSKYKNWKTTKFMSYCRNHLTYLYNLTDDSQMVYTKIANMHPTQHKHWYIIPYAQFKLPTHIFPCSNDIDSVCEYILYEVKLTNRISLIIRKDDNGSYVYIEYKHLPNVDIDKSELIIREIMQNVYKI